MEVKYHLEDLSLKEQDTESDLFQRTEENLI